MRANLTVYSVLVLFSKAYSEFMSLGSPETCASKCLTGPLADCCCSYDDLRETNEKTVHKLLRQVVQTPFFSHFMMDPCAKCTLWEDKTMCEIQDCGVCNCQKHPDFLTPEDIAEARESDSDCQKQLNTKNIIHMSADDYYATPWSTPPEDAGEVPQMEVVNLLKNPELFTGYNGSKVWKAIHEETCFKPKRTNSWCEALLPAEQRLYNKLLAGLHSSISLHISAHYCAKIVDWKCQRWIRNKTHAVSQVLSHPDRVEALYFIYAVVLRAVIKAVDQVVAVIPAEPEYSESSQDWKLVVPALEAMAKQCPHTFDETLMFVGEEGEGFRKQVWNRFRHLRQIIKCVGCDRCKLWGTLQTLGLGSALKVLFPADTGEHKLSRQEAVALVNVLERISSAIEYLQEFRGMAGKHKSDSDRMTAKAEL